MLTVFLLLVFLLLLFLLLAFFALLFRPAPFLAGTLAPALRACDKPEDCHLELPLRFEFTRVEGPAELFDVTWTAEVGLALLPPDGDDARHTILVAP